MIKLRFTREEARDWLNRLPKLLTAFDAESRAKENVLALQDSLKTANDHHKEHKAVVKDLGGKI